eukprot:scaffold217_cov99-Cylindrotheca_fusiformis.AAC.3
MAFGWIRKDGGMDGKADCYGRKILSLQPISAPQEKLLDRGIESTSAFVLWEWRQRHILYIGYCGIN